MPRNRISRWWILDLIKEIDVERNLLPFPVESILIRGGVLPQDAKFFTSDPLKSNVFLDINEELQNPLFVARTLTNNLKPEDYPKISNIQAFIETFALFNEER